VRRHLAFYIGGMGRFYREAVARHGFTDVAETVGRLWATRARGAAAAPITDELLDAFAIVGDAARCRARLDVYRSAGADLPVLALPGDVTVADAERTVRALGEPRG
jgi:hypothetical protein